MLSYMPYTVLPLPQAALGYQIWAHMNTMLKYMVIKKIPRQKPPFHRNEIKG